MISEWFCMTCAQGSQRTALTFQKIKFDVNPNSDQKIQKEHAPINPCVGPPIKAYVETYVETSVETYVLLDIIST